MKFHEILTKLERDTCISRNWNFARNPLFSMTECQLEKCIDKKKGTL